MCLHNKAIKVSYCTAGLEASPGLVLHAFALCDLYTKSKGWIITLHHASAFYVNVTFFRDSSETEMLLCVV